MAGVPVNPLPLLPAGRSDPEQGPCVGALDKYRDIRQGLHQLCKGPQQ